MLTSAGVSVPDGNELLPFQTGLWGAFLRELQQRQPGGLDHAWVSFFSYEPAVGATIFADWARSLPQLTWLHTGAPKAVERTGDRLTAVHFDRVTIQANILLDGTELGDLLALGDVPYRWGWEWRSHWQEPSAPEAANSLTDQYPVQAPTWVVMMQDFGEGQTAPPIDPAPTYDPTCFTGAWSRYGLDECMNYGRLPGDRFMINWPICGNDYGDRLYRLIESDSAHREWMQEARWHSQNFAYFIQQQGGQRYGLALSAFPESVNPAGSLGGGAYAVHPYYRESRRLVGVTTVREQDILPQVGGLVAPLPVDSRGTVTAIALGNYANDHHYPNWEFSLAPKSIRWGGRWTGTPFALPYGCLVPEQVDGLLVCEKNISVSHIANGATRLQPVVLGLGQAAGMAAALCIEQNCQPRDLDVRSLQMALLTDRVAPATLIPLWNVAPGHPDWLAIQKEYLHHPDRYPLDGYHPQLAIPPVVEPEGKLFSGWFERWDSQNYRLHVDAATSGAATASLSLVTLNAAVDEKLKTYPDRTSITLWGRENLAGKWLIVEAIADPSA
jgi:hypothetical protein